MVRYFLWSPWAGAIDASRSTEHRDSIGTLMLYTWLKTRGCSLKVWLTEEAEGNGSPSGICLLTLVVRTSLLSPDGAECVAPWSERKYETKKHYTCCGLRGFVFVLFFGLHMTVYLQNDGVAAMKRAKGDDKQGYNKIQNMANGVTGLYNDKTIFK